MSAVLWLQLQSLGLDGTGILLLVDRLNEGENKSFSLRVSTSIMSKKHDIHNSALWAILIQKGAKTLFKKVKIPVARISKYHTEEAPRVID